MDPWQLEDCRRMMTKAPLRRLLKSCLRLLHQKLSGPTRVHWPAKAPLCHPTFPNSSRNLMALRLPGSQKPRKSCESLATRRLSPDDDEGAASSSPDKSSLTPSPDVVRPNACTLAGEGHRCAIRLFPLVVASVQVANIERKQRSQLDRKSVV